MPTLRIISDALCDIYIDGNHVGQVEPEVIGSYELSSGNHFVKAICPYHDSLSTMRIVNVRFDFALELSFSQWLKSHIEALDKMELFRFQIEGKTGVFEPITRSIIVPPVYDSCSLFTKEGFAVVTLNDLKGVIDKRGEILVPLSYDEISCYSNGFIVYKGEESAMLDLSGSPLLTCPSKLKVCFDEGRIGGCYVKNEDRVVFFDSQGRRLIEGDYDFYSVEKKNNHSYISAKKDDRTVVYDFYGRRLLDCSDGWLTDEGGFFSFRQGGKYGAFDYSGKSLLPIEYDEMFCRPGGFISLIKGDESRCVRFDGDSIKDWPFQVYRRISDDALLFGDGDARIYYDVKTERMTRFLCDDIELLANETADKREYCFLKIRRNHMFGVVEMPPSRRVICDCIYDEIHDYVNGYACVKQFGRYGAIDRDGRLTVPCVFGSHFFFSSDGYASVFNYNRNNEGYILPNDIIDVNGRCVLGIHPFTYIDWYWKYTRDSHPVLLARSNPFNYLIDFNGNILGQYDHCSTPTILAGSESFIVGNKNNGVVKYGWVDKYGNEKIACRFDDVSRAGCNLLWCEEHGRKALFNHNGKQLTRFDYVAVEPFVNGLSFAKKDTGYGILSSSGKEISAFTYNRVDHFYVGRQFQDDNVWEYDSDEEGNVYASLAAEVEGPFRYGIAALYSKNKDNEYYSQVFLDVHGNKVLLRQLGERLFESLPTESEDQPEPEKDPRIYQKHPGIQVYFTKVSGVTYGDRQQVISTLNEGVPLELKREPTNQYDSNAIAVCDTQGHQVGYIPKDLASQLAPQLDKGKHFNTKVTSITGGDGFNYGLNIIIKG